MTIVDDSLELEGGRPVYRYYVAWTISGELALEVPFGGVTWSRQIRKAGTFSGTVSFENDDRLREAFAATMPGRMSVFITREGDPVWGGFIARRVYDPLTKSLQLEATGFEAYLYRRTIWHDTVQTNATDQYQVVRNLIGLMQTDYTGLATEGDRADPHPDNANLGITVSPINSGKTQDQQNWNGFQLQSFGEAIEGFSDNLNGFEYNIEIGFDVAEQKFTKNLVFRDTPPSQLPTGVEYTGTRPGLEENYFEFPGNIITLGYDDNIDDASTRYWVTGKQPEPIGDEELPVPRGAWDNEAYYATNWPIFELINSSDHAEASLLGTLDGYAAVYGQRTKPPAGAWTVTVNGAMNPHVGSFNPGDWCRLVVTDPFLSQAIDTGGQVTKILTKRIAAYSVTVPDTEQVPEVVTLTLIDEWNDGGA